VIGELLGVRRGVRPVLPNDAAQTEEAGLEVEVRLPQFAVVHVFNAFPESSLAAVLVPALAEVAVVQTKTSEVPTRKAQWTPLVIWPMGTSSSGLWG